MTSLEWTRLEKALSKQFNIRRRGGVRFQHGLDNGRPSKVQCMQEKKE